MTKSWYNIKNALPETGLVEVYIDNEIGEFGISARQFLNELKPHAGKPVRLHINSPGGIVTSGLAI
jgi:ATP-dependent protease ClpP protease subunit